MSRPRQCPEVKCGQKLSSTWREEGPQWEESLWKPGFWAATLSRSTDMGSGAGSRGTRLVTPGEDF